MNDITNLSAAVASTASTRAPAALDAPATAAKTTPGVLSGSNLTITSALSDIDKLVAQLEADSAETRASVNKMRISSVMQVLESMNIQLTADQTEAFGKVLDLQSQENAAEVELATLYTKYGVIDDASASLVMDMAIETLEKAIERAVQEGKDHNENVEAAEEQRTEDQQSEDVDKLREQLETAKADKARIAELQSTIASLSSQISAAAVSIGELALRAIANALKVRVTAEEIDTDDKPESQAEQDKEALKELETNPLESIRESLNRLDEVVLKTIGENQQLKA